ncbi:cupin domain-containing protein [Nocardia sp. NPDC002869]|uniref:cupin domain-containing protein n=1 Tax=Nocardia sp. NPDC002869 TaxID=3161032 RepID=UPI00398CE4BC
MLATVGLVKVCSRLRPTAVTIALTCRECTRVIGPRPGYIRYRHVHRGTQVMTSLPQVLHIRADHGGNCLDDTVRLLSRELAYPQIATAFVLNRLVDILLVQLLRVWLAKSPDEARDPGSVCWPTPWSATRSPNSIRSRPGGGPSTHSPRS